MDVFLYLDINGNSLEQITVAMSNQKRFSETKPNVRILEKSSCFLGQSEKKRQNFTSNLIIPVIFLKSEKVLCVLFWNPRLKHIDLRETLEAV